LLPLSGGRNKAVPRSALNSKDPGRFLAAPHRGVTQTSVVMPVSTMFGDGGARRQPQHQLQVGGQNDPWAAVR